MSPLLVWSLFINFHNSGLCWTVFARNRDTAVPAEGNGDLQTRICVLVARPRRCLRLSNHVPWQNWMAAYLGYNLQMRTLFRCSPIMVNDTHTRRRRLNSTFTMSFSHWHADLQSLSVTFFHVVFGLTLCLVSTDKMPWLSCYITVKLWQMFLCWHICRCSAAWAADMFDYHWKENARTAASVKRCSHASQFAWCTWCFQSLCSWLASRRCWWSVISISSRFLSFLRHCHLLVNTTDCYMLLLL